MKVVSDQQFFVIQCSMVNLNIPVACRRGSEYLASGVYLGTKTLVGKNTPVLKCLSKPRLISKWAAYVQKSKKVFIDDL